MAYEDEDGPEAESRVTEVRKKWKETKEGWASWRSEARNCYAFVSGDQWAQEDIAKLETEGRPATTFNRIAPMIDAVSGLEINNRMSIRYFPREVGDVKPNEILTATADWIRDQTGSEDEESEAFKDAAICGVGCTETRMDYEEDSEGKVIDERRDPLMVFPDPNSKQRGFKDARYVFHAEWVDKEDIEAKWPDSEVVWSDDDLGYETPGDGDQSFKYDGDDEPQNDLRRNKGLVLHYQCWKREPYYRVFDPFQQKNVEISEEDFKKLEKNGAKAGLSFKKADVAGEKDIAYVKMQKRVFYRGFYVGGTELEYGKSPLQTGFSFKFITAKRDRNKGCWYGIVRVMMDPQRWANKWMSQILHIINSNAKGGAFIEEGALVDKRKAEEQWAQAAPLILLTEGSIEKVKERTPASYPAGLDRLMQFAFESMPFVTGINLEMLGLANREQAGVLEAQRRKAAMAILASLFASVREFRKEKGRLYLEFIEKFIPEGRIIRVIGKNNKVQYVPFVKQADLYRHDVVIDESPDSPDFREQAWAGLQEVLPALIKQGIAIPPEALAYAPLPSEVADSLANSMKGQLPPQVQQQMQQMQQKLQQAGQEVQKLGQENQQLKADRSADFAKVQAKVMGDQAKLGQKAQQGQLEARLEQFGQQLESQTRKFEAMMDANLKRFEIMTKAQTEIRKEAIRGAATVRAAKEKPRPAAS